METFQIEYRCTCESLLFKGFVVGSLVEIKCRRCGKLNVFGEVFSAGESKYFVVVYSETGAILECSTTACTVLGYSKEELLSLTAFDVGVGTTPERYKMTWEAARSAKFSPIVADARLYTKTGSIVEARVKFVFSTTGKHPHATVIGEVVREWDTDEKGAVLLISDSIQIEDLVAQINQDGYFVYASEKFLKMVDYTIEELINLNLFENLSFKKNKEKMIHDISCLIKQHKPFYIPDNGFVSKNGEKKYIDIHYVPVFSDANRFKGYKLIHSFKSSHSGEK